jgi:hypothetical protein
MNGLNAVRNNSMEKVECVRTSTPPGNTPRPRRRPRPARWSCRCLGVLGLAGATAGNLAGLFLAR